MKSSHKLDDQTRLSRLMGALAETSERPVAELGMDELTRELETHGIQAIQVYAGVAALFEKAGLPAPEGLRPVKADPEWLIRAREKKRWFREKLKQVKEAAQDTLSLGAEPVPVFFRNQNSNEPPSADQDLLKQDQKLLELIEQDTKQ